MYDSSPMSNKIICAFLICFALASPTFAQRGSIPAATLLAFTKA